VIEYAAPQISDRAVPFRSRLREIIRGRSEELEALAVEMYARGLSTRDIEALFADERGQSLLSRTAVSEITQRLWADGGTLAWNGIAFLAWLELAVSGDYGRRARATSWRSVTRRLQASPDCLFCPAELRHPRAGFWPPWFPLRHESFVASLRLGGNQHLAVA
jgi:hypothetical protein